MQPQCTNCGAFTRRSFHHEEDFQSSVLLERLRTSNFPATDEEISHIRITILPTISDDISSIDSRVASLHEAIKSMEEERERLTNVQRKYSNLISSHRTFPLEIWSEIFLHTLSSTSHYNAFDAAGSIWQLSHVSQTWRNVALSLRSFWSTMDLHFMNSAQLEGDVQRLETVIQRSGKGLLDVSLSGDLSSDAQTPRSPLVNRMLEIILAESCRWRKLHLSVYEGSLNMLYASLHNRLPRLECLHLYYAQIEPNERLVFKDCPRLTKVTLGEGTLAVELPWDQITELHLSLMDLSDEEDRRACMRLIGQCPLLEILSAPFWNSEDEDESPYSPITCSNMSKFDVASVPVIDALTLPILREASLHPDPPETHRYSILSSFQQLLIRSSCLRALASLSLANVPLASSPNRTLHSLLSQTHSLTFLNMTISKDGNYDDQTDISNREQIVMIVKSLEVIPTKTVTFLPLLSSLFIQVHDHNNPSNLQYFGPVGSFASTLKNRWEGDDMVGLARLRICHFAVHARHLHTIIYRDAESFLPNIFNVAERFMFNVLIDDGMDLAIEVTSKLNANFGGPGYCRFQVTGAGEVNNTH